MSFLSTRLLVSGAEDGLKTSDQGSSQRKLSGLEDSDQEEPGLLNNRIRSTMHQGAGEVNSGISGGETPGNGECPDWNVVLG